MLLISIMPRAGTLLNIIIMHMSMIGYNFRVGKCKIREKLH
jgi:hypothetical protein